MMPGGSRRVPLLQPHAARVAIVVGGSGQNLYPPQDWLVRPVANP
jgi:hypothetical protein